MGKAFPDGATLKRYDLPPIRGEGWATIVLGADGFFAAVTAFGNYAFRWCHTGEADFRNFMLGITADYLLSKISSEDVYDGDATSRMIKQHILEHRRQKWYSRDHARKEWDHLLDCEVAHGVDAFHAWCEGTELGDAYEMRVDTYPIHAQMFAEKTMPRLREMLRAELTMDAEERRAMDEQERRKVAVEIADALGETGEPWQAPRERVERQIVRMIAVMGEEWVRARMPEAWAHLGDDRSPVATRGDGGPRTLGGTFFQVAREAAIRIPEMQKRDFYRTFCWRERKPREPKPAPAPRRDKAHEARAVALYASVARVPVARLSVVTEPRDGIWYDWADPGSGQYGQCMREGGAWVQAPCGRRPVVLAFQSGSVKPKRRAEPEVYVTRRAAR